VAVGPEAADPKTAWRAADSCPRSTTHKKQTLLYLRETFSRLGPLGLCAARRTACPMGTTSEPIRERFHKSAALPQFTFRSNIK
jgi:hypothetical protein